MKPFRLYLALVISSVLVFSFSCGTKVNPKVAYKNSYSSYSRVVKQWTRTKKQYDKILDTVMVISATYESKAFRKVYLAEKIRAEAIPGEMADRLIRKSEKELEDKAVFFVTLYTPEHKWNRLESHDASFKLWLIDEKGNKVAPLKVDRIRKISRATTRYYPHWDRFSYCYRVVFPRKTDQGQPLELEKGRVTFLAAGVFGKAELVWDIP